VSQPPQFGCLKYDADMRVLVLWGRFPTAQKRQAEELKYKSDAEQMDAQAATVLKALAEQAGTLSGDGGMFGCACGAHYETALSDASTWSAATHLRRRPCSEPDHAFGARVRAAAAQEVDGRLGDPQAGLFGLLRCRPGQIPVRWRTSHDE